jgi:hypothetical protein
MADLRDLDDRREPRFGETDPARPPEFAAMPHPQEELGPLGLEFESVVPPKPRHRTGLRLFMVFVALMIGGGAVGWYLLGDRFKSAETGGDVPIVRADINPAKVRPSDPGGMEVPNRDKTIYDQLTPGEPREDKVERLLPPPEEPKAPEPAPQVGDSEPPPPPAAPDPNAPLPRSPRSLKPEPVAPQSPVPSPREVEIARKPAEPTIAAPTPGSLQPPPAANPVSRVEAVGMQTQPAPAPAQPPAAASAPTPPAIPEPKPAPTAVAAAPEPTPAPVVQPAPAKGGAYKIQIGALRTRAEAEAEWKKQQKAHPDLLGGLTLTVVEVEVRGKGTFFRIRGGGLPSEEAAKDLCGKLTAKKVACLVVKPGN